MTWNPFSSAPELYRLDLHWRGLLGSCHGWLLLSPPLLSCFLLSFCLLAFAAAAAGDGGRSPFHFAGAFGPAFSAAPLGGCIVFASSGGP